MVRKSVGRIACEIAETASGHGCGTRGRRRALHPLRGDAPVTWPYTRSERVQCLRIGCNAYGSGAPHNARIPQRRVCRPARIARRQEHTKPQDPQAPPVWRAPEGPEGTGGLRGTAPNEVRTPSLAGGRALRRPEHPWGHKQHHQWGGPPPTGTSSSPPPLVWRAPEGPEGTGGLRGAAPNAVRPPSLAGGRALRRPKHPWCHNDTRPRPVSRPRPRHAHAAALSTAPPAIRRSCPRDPRPRRGQPRGGRRGRGTGSRTRSPGPHCGRSGSTAGRHRARHTRRA